MLLVEVALKLQLLMLTCFLLFGGQAYASSQGDLIKDYWEKPLSACKISSAYIHLSFVRIGVSKFDHVPASESSF